MTERYHYDSALEKVYDDETFNGESTESYGVFECCEIMNEQYEYIERLKRNFRVLDEVKCELVEENEQLKEVLGSILIEVRRDISATNHSSEVKAFVTPNSFDLISDVLKKYGALKDWYE